MDKYRVIVIREGDDDETLFEIAGSAAMVARLAPTALLDVLGADADQTDPAPAANLADRVLDSALAAGGAPQFADAEPVKQTRNRRTKAQIAADKEAEGLGFRDAAHRAEVEAQEEVPAEPVVTEQPAPEPVASTPPPAIPVAGPPAAAPADGAPWNPFVQPTH
jgi:hypothetical protein